MQTGLIGSRSLTGCDDRPDHIPLQDRRQARRGRHGDVFIPPAEAAPRVKAAVNEALKLDEELAEAHAMNGYMKLDRLDPRVQSAVEHLQCRVRAQRGGPV